MNENKNARRKDQRCDSLYLLEGKVLPFFCKLNKLKIPSVKSECDTIFYQIYEIYDEY